MEPLGCPRRRRRLEHCQGGGLSGLTLEVSLDCPKRPWGLGDRARRVDEPPAKPKAHVFLRRGFLARNTCVVQGVKHHQEPHTTSMIILFRRSIPMQSRMQ